MRWLALLCVVLSIHYGKCADPKVILRQTYPETTVIDGIKTMVVEKDHDAFLACVVDNRPKDKEVQWLGQNYKTNTNIAISTDTDAQNANKFQIDKPADNNWRLRIQNVQVEDEALYICRVQLTSQQNANDSRIIKVVQKPQIVDIYTSSDTTTEEGARVELTCDASGIPTPVITWQLVGGGTLPTGGRELVSRRLEIPVAKAEHKGDYKCIAENDAGRDVRRIYLNVQFMPRLQPESPEVYQAVGYDKEVKCEAYGNPVPTDKQVIWYKEGVPLSGDKYVFSNYFGSNYVLMKLRIKDINEQDYGSYKCYAENAEGDGSNTVLLRRSGSPTSVTSDDDSSANFLSLSITTIAMGIITALLHTC